MRPACAFNHVCASSAGHSGGMIRPRYRSLIVESRERVGRCRDIDAVCGFRQVASHYQADPALRSSRRRGVRTPAPPASRRYGWLSRLLILVVGLDDRMLRFGDLRADISTLWRPNALAPHRRTRKVANPLAQMYRDPRTICSSPKLPIARWCRTAPRSCWPDTQTALALGKTRRVPRRPFLPMSKRDIGPRRKLAARLSLVMILHHCQ